VNGRLDATGEGPQIPSMPIEERPERADRREFGHVYQRGRTWWIRYRVNGREHRESSHSTSRRQAERLLEQRKGQLDVDALTPPAMRGVTYEDLEKFVRNDYRKAARRSLPRVEHALTHLRDAFGGWRALSITLEQIGQYELDRLDSGAARATVNYELAVLRRAFRLAVKARRLSSMPAISISAPKNARSGFFEPADFALVLAQLPAHLQPVMRFAYLTGWRVKSEVLPLTWDRVDFDAGIVSLYHSKNDEPRQFPFDALPELAALLGAQRATTTELERSAGRIIPHVFHRNGKGIKSYRTGWTAAVRRASTTNAEKGALTVIVRPQLAGRIVHDFRRTAVRNLVRAGVDEQLAMKLTGHKTRAVFDRYRITNEADLRAGVEKLANYLGSTAKKPTKGTMGAQSAKKRRLGGR
jgi:site-specific recombinase XerD